MNMQTSNNTTVTNIANPNEAKTSPQAEFANPSTELVSMIQKNMQDIPADLDEEATLNLIYYKYLHLYDAWTKERQDTQVQVAQLKDLVKTFDAQVKAFASFEDKIRQNLLDMVRRSVTGGILEVSGRLLEETTEGAKKVTRDLRVEVDTASSELRHYKSYLNRQHVKTIGVVAAVLIVVTLVTIKVLMPAPMTAELFNNLATDKTYHDVWVNLSSSQKERVQKIVNETQANKS